MKVDQPPRGMLDAPMRKCRTCDKWSYIAAVTGRCLTCIQEAHKHSQECHTSSPASALVEDAHNSRRDVPGGGL